MKGRAIIATHHKTGTVWMGGTFRGICKELAVPFLHFHRTKPEVAAAPAPVVFLDGHARWFQKATPAHRTPDDRMLHMIRDPRDVIISAMHYHRVSQEEWLHEPQERFGGSTYQQKSNSLGDDRARYLFEMDHSAGHVIRSMAGWEYGRPDCFECKYEDLMVDTDMALFARAAAHVGFEADEIETCRQEFRKNSLFSGIPQERAKQKGKIHIRSGDSRQWRNVFDRELSRAFIERFGDVLIRLGYEKDDSWTEEQKQPALEQAEPSAA